MIRFVFRAVGFILLAAAFAALVVDGSRSIAGGRLLQYSLEDTLAWLAAPRWGAALQAVGAWPAAVQRLVLGLLAVPGWLVLGAAGLALMLVGRPARENALFSGRPR